MTIKLNFGSDDDKGFEPLEPGYYSGVIKEIEQKIGKNSGKPYLAFTIGLVPDPDRGVKKGRQVWTNMSLSPNALWRLKKFLVEMGEDKSALSGEFEFDPASLMGSEVLVELGNPDQGYSNNRVENVHASDYEVPAEGTSGF